MMMYREKTEWGKVREAAFGIDCRNSGTGQDTGELRHSVARRPAEMTARIRRRTAPRLCGVPLPALSVFVLSVFTCCFQAGAQFFYNEPGTGTSGIFQLRDQAKYTAAAGIDLPGSGWIRLTELKVDNTAWGYIILYKTFPSNMGVTVEFDFKIYGRPSGLNADGISVFLIDGGRNAGAFQIGSAGGGLLFASQGSSSGARPTYLGVGLDEYGTFSSTSVGRGGVGETPQSIALRTGSLPGSNYRYYYLGGTGRNMGALNKHLSHNRTMTTRPNDNTYYRRVRIDFAPSGNGMKVEVGMKTSLADNAFTSVFTHNYTSGAAFTPRPDVMRVGIAATTGQEASIHEIRNVIVRTYGGLQVFKTIPDCRTPEMPVTTFVACNVDSAMQVAVQDTLPAGYTVSGSPVITGGSLVGGTGITTAYTSDGRAVYSCSLRINANSVASIVWNGRFDTPSADGLFRTSARITPLPGFTVPAGQLLEYAALSDTVHYITPLQPQAGAVPYMRGRPVTFSVKRGAGTFAWEYSTSGGTNWTNCGSDTVCSPPAALFDTDGFRLRCIATFDTPGCNDIVEYVCMALPDNIVEADCFAKPPTEIFKIRDMMTGQPQINNLQTRLSPVVGDVDGDGRTEILVAMSDGDYRAKDILVVDGLTGSVKDTIVTPSVEIASGLAIYKTGDATCVLVPVARDHAVAADRLHLVAYRYDRTDKEWKEAWKSGDTFLAGKTPTTPVITDLDGDGTPEIVIGNRIFNARTGNRLADFPVTTVNAKPNTVLHTATGTLLNTDDQQLVIAGKVYSVAFANKNGFNANAFTEKASAPSTSLPLDVTTVPADFNRDGHLDILFTGVDSLSAGGPNVVYAVWDVHNSRFLGNKVYDDIPAGAGANTSVPLVGEINGDSIPEFVFMTGNRIYCYRYNPQADEIEKYWHHDVSDASGETGITLFDFDQNKRVELVLRDRQQLWILDGSQKDNCVPAERFPGIHTGAGPDYAVVADINGDGYAEIVTTGAATAGNLTDGVLRILGAEAGKRWAPARKVWNQYAYRAVNVNEDLTIPNYPLNPATVFSGTDGLWGTPDDRRPFNSFLQQQTILKENGDPVWLQPDAELLKAFCDYDPQGDTVRVYAEFTNRGDAGFLPPFHVCLTYGDSTASSLYHYTDSVMSVVRPGDTLSMAFTVSTGSFPPCIIAPGGVRKLPTVALNSQGAWANGSLQYELQECDSLNSVQDVSPFFGVFHDKVTIQKYRWAEIDALGNDLLPAGYFAGGFSLLDSVVMQPLCGTLYVDGSAADSRFIYINTGTAGLTGQIDSFSYALTFDHPELGTLRRTATVYIYLLEDMDDASACYGQSDYLIRLRQHHPGVTLHWNYAADSPDATPPFLTDTDYSPGVLMADSVWQIRPVDSNVSARWNQTLDGFPAGLFTLHADPSATPPQMRWTGDISSDWRDPRNWVEQAITAGGLPYESAVDWLPSRCTNVVIPSGLMNYPELTDSVSCAGITVKDRAMLKNPHLLRYDSATVELVPIPQERDRYLMLSAPLMEMYSGDYHFPNGNSPQWGDVYMNFFGQASPAGGLPSPNTFTNAAGRANTELHLGKAFNLRVVTTSATRDRPLVFPQAFTEYRMMENGTETVLSAPRSNLARKFIIAASAINPVDTTFNIPLEDNAGRVFVQVVNPYLAYLDVEKFLAGNSDSIAQSGYQVWDGYPGQAFTPVLPPYNTEARRLIAPMRSFFVQKYSDTTLTAVRMSPNWTTTQGRHPYVLRAEPEETGILRIRAEQHNSVGEALLRCDANATPAYFANEDMQTLFFDENPLTLYSFAHDAPLMPLAANASNRLEQHPVSLGLRLREAGEVRLTFSGLETFGHRVYLIDRELGNARFDLKENPVYTFTANKPQNVQALELNDRFTLAFEHADAGLETTPSSWTVTAYDGILHVRAMPGVISCLEVYTSAGVSVYRSQTSATDYRIPAGSGQVYFIKVCTPKGEETGKAAGR
jgi:hypothetical protein